MSSTAAGSRARAESPKPAKKNTEDESQAKPTPGDPAASSDKEQSLEAKRAVRIGSIFTFVYFLGLTGTMPFLQAHRDTLGCDALCYGSQTSLRSALSLVGSVVVNRLSDRIGRRPTMWFGITGSLASLSISLALPSLTGMWLAIVPSALLDHNASVMKALFTDYFVSEKSSTSEAECAGAVGQIGMALGFAMMVGSGLGARVVSTYWGAQSVGIIIVLASSPLIQLLPSPTMTPMRQLSDSGWVTRLRKMASLPILKSPGVQLLIGLRFSMGMAFWLFYSIWTPSLKSRFNFGPADHGQFMAFIGLTYALAQGVIAKPLVRLFSTRFGGSSTLMFCCMCVLGCGRIGAFMTTDLRVVYLFFGAGIIALGVVNILISSDAARLASGDGQTGGLYGILEACESVTGMIGPALGGMLSRVEASYELPHLVLGAVVALYLANGAAVLFCYGRHPVQDCQRSTVRDKVD